MDEFQLQLQGLIAQNKIPQVIKILLETLQKCESKNPTSKDTVNDLRNQVVILSARYNSNNDKILKGIIDPIHAGTAKNQVISSFLNLISQLPNSTEYSNYINHREEEDAWDNALKANTIAGYKAFFTQYPNGKYKDETQRIISELESIQKEKENEIKQKAEEEKARRTKEQQELKAQEQANSERQRIKKEQTDTTKNKQRKAAAKRQRTTETKKEKTPAKAQAAIGTATGIAAAGSTSKESQSFFAKLFNKNNRWWTLISIILAPFTGSIIGLLAPNVKHENTILFLIGLTFLSYILIAFKFPLKPAWRSLIATAIGAFLFLIGFTIFDKYGISNLSEFLLMFAFSFIPINLFLLPICFFRNKSIAKKNNSEAQ